MTINYRHTEPGTGAAYFAYRGLVNSGAETGNLSVTAFVAGWNAAMATMEEKKNPVDVDAPWAQRKGRKHGNGRDDRAA